jgi:flagellar protein FliO/FliZ
VIAPAVAPAGPDGTALTGGYGEMVVSSLLVLVIVCVAAWLVVRFGVRRMWGPRGGQVMDVVARVPLEPRRSLYVVDVAGKTLLVGTSEMGLSVLSELDGDVVRARLEARASERSVAAGFAEAVRAAMGRRRAGAPATPAEATAAPVARDGEVGSGDAPGGDSEGTA